MPTTSTPQQRATHNRALIDRDRAQHLADRAVADAWVAAAEYGAATHDRARMFASVEVNHHLRDALTWQARADREAELIAATAYGPTHFEAMAS